MVRPLHARKGQDWWATFWGRVLLTVGVPLQLGMVWLNWPSLLGIMNLLMAVFLIWVGVMVGRRNRERRQRTWSQAEQSGDPLMYLAGASYIDKLTLPEFLVFIEWMAAHDPFDPEHAAQMPPVVAGYLRVITSPPRE